LAKQLVINNNLVKPSSGRVCKFTHAHPGCHHRLCHFLYVLVPTQTMGGTRPTGRKARRGARRSAHLAAGEVHSPTEDHELVWQHDRLRGHAQYLQPARAAARPRRGPRAHPTDDEACGGGCARSTRPPARSAAPGRTSLPGSTVGCAITQSTTISLGQMRSGGARRATVCPCGAPRADPTDSGACRGGRAGVAAKRLADGRPGKVDVAAASFAWQKSGAKSCDKKTVGLEKKELWAFFNLGF
jgi:hypothetical protein